MSESKNKWICTEEKTLVRSPFMEIIQRECKSSEDNRTHRFFLFKSRDWCNIIPITADGKVVLVKQFRIGVSEHTLEIPGGVVDPADTDIQTAAIREMAEETGYVPLPHARCIPLGWTHPNPAIQDNRCHLFVVGPVQKQKNQSLDPGEMIEVSEVPIEEFLKNLTQSEITHALILNAFLLLLLKAPETLSILSRELEGFRGNHP